MMHKSLYQKYRPRDFSEVVGQEKIVQTLRNALISRRIGHAYLFSGPRGTGKTTIARILAKAVNCQLSLDPKSDICPPCLKCSFCLAAGSGQAIDIIEIDAASNRGIDEIRDLREKAKFAPSLGRFKVYIIDEVHMLTREAFNALLKTLEEPPSHVIFIMATTEVHKLPATILSRVQRFDFGRVSREEIAQNLADIIKKEKLSVDQVAINLIAAKAEGSHRDAISLLEQIKSYASKISLKEVEEVLGIANTELVIDLLDKIKVGDRRAMLTKLEAYLASGFDVGQLALSLAECLRQLIFLKADLKGEVILSAEQLKKMEALLDLSVQDLVKATDLILVASREIKTSQIPSLPLELALSSIVDLWAAESRPESVISSQLSGKTEAKSEIIQKPVEKLKSEPEQELKQVVIKPEIEASGGSLESIDENVWQKILAEAKTRNHSLSALLRDVKPDRIDGVQLYLLAKFKFHADKISEAKNRQLIEDIIEEATGQKLAIKCQIVDVTTKPVSKSSNDLVKAAEEIFK